MLDYPLPRIHCLVAAVVRHEARQHAALLQLIAAGVRASGDDIADLADRLTHAD